MLSVGQLAELRASAQTVASLDQLLGTESDTTVGDLRARDPFDFEEQAHLGLDHENVRRAVARLPEREQRVIRLRFGLDLGEPLTLGEIGQGLGCSRERARQLEIKGLERRARASEVEAIRRRA